MDWEEEYTCTFVQYRADVPRAAILCTGTRRSEVQEDVHFLPHPLRHKTIMVKAAKLAAAGLGAVTIMKQHHVPYTGGTHKQAEEEVKGDIPEQIEGGGGDGGGGGGDHGGGEIEESAGGGGFGGGGSMGGNHASHKLGGWVQKGKVRTATYRKTMYHHIPNSTDRVRIEPKYTDTEKNQVIDGATLTYQSRKCDTGWFEIPWDYACMFMSTGDTRELFSKADWIRYKKIKCRMFNFMALNDKQTTAGGAAIFTTTPTENLYVMVLHDKEDLLPWREPTQTDKPNYNGSRPICDDRDKSMLKELHYTINVNKQSKTSYYPKEGMDPWRRCAHQIETHYLPNLKLKFEHNLAGEKRLASHPLWPNSDHVQIMWPYSYKSQYFPPGNAKQQFHELAEQMDQEPMEHLGRLNPYWKQHKAAFNKTTPSNYILGENTNNATFSSIDQEITGTFSGMYEKQLMGGNRLYNIVPIVALKGAPIQGPDNKPIQYNISFMAEYELEIEYGENNLGWPARIDCPMKSIKVDPELYGPTLYNSGWGNQQQRRGRKRQHEEDLVECSASGHS